jgi:putative two-component system response regulator
MVGWRILQPLLVDTPAALNIVRWHHERVDGRGVPDGLAGDQIPLEARIAAAADAIDAMTSGRPYRLTGMSFEQTLFEMRRCVGAQFDPEVIQAMFDAFEAGELLLLPHTGEISIPA